MAVTGIEKDINLPGPEKRANGHLLDAMMPIPPDELVTQGTNRFPLGIEWLPWGTDNLSSDAVDCAVVYDMAARSFPDLVVQPAFMLWDALQCSTLSSIPDWIVARLRNNMEVYSSAAFASELGTAAASGGLSIAGDVTYAPNVVSDTAVSTRVAIHGLETHLAGVLHGGKGMIHVSAGLLALLVADDLVFPSGNGFRTATGHTVVGDAGFSGGYTPQGGTAAAAGEEWAYATGQVFYAIGAINRSEVLTDDQHETELLENLNRPILKRAGLITWDPSMTGAVKVSIA